MRIARQRRPRRAAVTRERHAAGADAHDGLRPGHKGGAVERAGKGELAALAPRLAAVVGKSHGPSKGLWRADGTACDEGALARPECDRRATSGLAAFERELGRGPRRAAVRRAEHARRGAVAGRDPARGLARGRDARAAGGKGALGLLRGGEVFGRDGRPGASAVGRALDGKRAIHGIAKEDAALAPKREAVVESVEVFVEERLRPRAAGVVRAVHARVRPVADAEHEGRAVAPGVNIAELQGVRPGHDGRRPRAAAVGRAHDGALVARGPDRPLVHGVGGDEQHVHARGVGREHRLADGLWRERRGAPYQRHGENGEEDQERAAHGGLGEEGTTLRPKRTAGLWRRGGSETSRGASGGRRGRASARRSRGPSRRRQRPRHGRCRRPAPGRAR